MKKIIDWLVNFNRRSQMVGGFYKAVEAVEKVNVKKKDSDFPCNDLTVHDLNLFLAIDKETSDISFLEVMNILSWFATNGYLMFKEDVVFEIPMDKKDFVDSIKIISSFLYTFKKYKSSSCSCFAL